MYNRELEQFRDRLWSSLRSVYRDYLKCGDKLSYEDAKNIILDNVHRDPVSCDVLMNRIYKMDMNADGKIDFTELGNFLIKGYCREISLQRYHLKKVRNGGCSRFMIDRAGFKEVINDAFSFLSVSISDGLAYYLYEKADTNCDHEVSYAEFFTITRQSFCQPIKRPEPKPCKRVPTTHLKLHIHVW